LNLEPHREIPNSKFQKKPSTNFQKFNALVSVFGKLEFLWDLALTDGSSLEFKTLSPPPSGQITLFVGRAGNGKAEWQEKKPRISNSPFLPGRKLAFPPERDPPK
jgi:hypothetical protein